MFCSPKKTALLTILSLLGGIQGALALPTQLDSNETLPLQAWDWYADRGTGTIQGAAFVLKGANSQAHATITGYLKQGETYELTGQASASVANKDLIGVAFYDANWKPLNDITAPLTTTLANFDLKFTVPTGAVSTVLHATGDIHTNTVITASSIQLKRDADNNKLLYAPPTLVNPITITLGTGTTYNNLDVTKDYIVKLPPTKKTGTTWLNGGHNIVIIGGYITLPVTSDLSNNANSRAIYIKNNNGTVHIEGVLIDASGGGMSDGIDISSPNSTVQVENVRVDGIYGFYNEFHADVIQPFGGVKDLRVDKLTGYTAYQGLTLGQDLGPIGSVELSRVNLVSFGTPIYGAGNNGGFLVWLTPIGKCNEAYPTTLSNVYAKQRSDRVLGNAVWPALSDPSCPSKVDTDGSVSFPALSVVKGVVEEGLPPSGDYVPVGVAGVNYISPGYQNQ